LSLTEEVYTEFSETWEAMMRSEAALWRKFHAWWLEQSGVPLFVLRYEDLRESPGHVLDALDKWLADPNHPAFSSGQGGVENASPAADAKTRDESDALAAAAAAAAEASAESTRGCRSSPVVETPSSPSPTLSSATPACGSACGTPYTPRVGGVGKSLRRFDGATPGLLDDVVRAAGPKFLKSWATTRRQGQTAAPGFLQTCLRRLPRRRLHRHRLLHLPRLSAQTTFQASAFVLGENKLNANSGNGSSKNKLLRAKVKL